MWEVFRNNLNNVTAVIGAVGSLMSVAATFESFTTINLYVRLFVTAATAFFVVEAVVRHQTRGVKSSTKFPWHGQNTGGEAPQRLKLSGLVIILINTVFVFLALIQTDRYIMIVDERHSGGTVSTDLFAPLPRVNMIILQLPSNAITHCDWHDLNRESIPRLVAHEIDWGMPNPILKLNDFVYPQAVHIECRYSKSIFASRLVDPPSTDFFLSHELWIVRIGIIITGGLLCAVAILRIIWLPR